MRHKFKLIKRKKMESKKIDRKEFLTNTSKFAVGAVAGAIGLNALAGGKIFAKSNSAAWPWPYQTLDPDAVRIRAHHLKLTGMECCAGCFGSIIEALKTKIGEPYNQIPYELMLFGRGGGAAWGSLCGAVNAAAAVISLVVNLADSSALIWEIYGWSASEAFPTNKANQFALDKKYTTGSFNGKSITQSVAGSVLCHASLTNWCNAAKKKVGDAERKERCGRITGDIAAKTVELLNAYFNKTFKPVFVTPDYANQCLSCHGTTLFSNVRIQESCAPCHGDPHQMMTKVVQDGGSTPTEYQLFQNYPNPFNPSTKIQFSLPQTGKVAVAIYDIMGQEVKRLVDYENLDTGKYTVEWNGVDNFGNKVTSGIYFARLTAGQYQQTLKMNLVK